MTDKYMASIVANDCNLYDRGMVSIWGSTGATMSVILDLPFTICNWISAAVAIIYTLMGGLFSVANTDVTQLVLMFIGLVSLLMSWSQVLLIF